jgi:pimeloyl-ACP methyl ester carboxylesterase
MAPQNPDTTTTASVPAFGRVRRYVKRLAILLLCGPACFYLVIIVVLLSLENRLLYRPTTAAAGWMPPAAGLRVDDVHLTSTDGTFLHAWWSPSPGWKPGDVAMLFLHGNGGNLSHRGSYISVFHKYLRTGVLLVDYPGYGRSEGVSTEKGCYAAGDAAYDWLTDEKEIPGEQIILYGGSLGGGVATDLASRRPHRALVLVSAFTSFPDQAQALYPWLPARWLVRNQFNNLAKLARVTGPVFITHGRVDELVPYNMSERLFAAAPQDKELFPMNYRGHSDVPDTEALAAMQRFLATPR